MTRPGLAPILVALVVVGIPGSPSVWAQGASDVAGRWTLNRELSQFPRELGFGVDWLPPGGPGPGSSTSGGRRGSGGGPTSAFTVRESADDARRVQLLTAEVRTPSAYLVIVETPTAVTITNDRGQTRTFHPDGKEEALQLDGVTVGVTAKREAGGLVVLYKVEQGRELRYTYARGASPAQLVVDVRFVERGGGDEVRRIYQPASETEVLAPPPPPPPARGSDSGGRDVPAAAGGLPAQGANQQPDAELKGLTDLGVVVEDLSPQAGACGLNKGALETAVSKRLSDAGFRVRLNSDEDTYVYVNVITTSMATGMCVSRYDVFLYTLTSAKLSYQSTPALVQVSLLHKGGIGGGAPAAHADGVLRGVQEYVDQFATRIRDANK